MSSHPGDRDNDGRPKKRPDGSQHGQENANALLNFAVNLLRGMAAFIEPSISQLPVGRDPKASSETSPEHHLEDLVLEPLRVMQPKVVRGVRRLLSRSFIVLALTVITLLLPPPPGLSEEGHRALALFVFTGSILALEPVSLPIAALLIPVAQVALGLGTVNQAFETFSRPTIFLILASLFLAEALRKHGLTRRLAFMTVVFSGGGVPLLLLGIMFVSAFLSMWVENTATAAVLIPVALTVARQVPDPKKARPFLLLLVLGIAYSASLGGMVTIMGSSSNAVASDYLSQIQTWTFIDWMKYGLPAFLLIFPVTWWLLLRLVKVEVKELDTTPAAKELEKQGSLSGTEKQLIGTMAVAAFFWVTGPGIEAALGLPQTLMNSANVAILAVGYLSVRNIIDWDDVKGVSWGVYLIIGAGLSLGEALTRAGVTDWFATLLEPVVSTLPFFATIMILVYVSALLTNLLNNTTIAAVFVPILIVLAQADPNLEPVQLVLPVTLATTFGYSLPSASGRMALVSSTGIVTRSEMMRYGLIMTLISSAILGLFFFFLTAVGLI